MHTEQLRLIFAVRMLVIIIEPGLTDGDYALVLGRGEQCAPPQIFVRVRFVRVDADAGEYIALSVGGADDLFPLSLLGGDVEKGPYPRLARAAEHASLIFDQPLIFEVTVAIDQHQVSSAASGSSRRGNSGLGGSIVKPPSAKGEYQWPRMPA